MKKTNKTNNINYLNNVYNWLGDLTGEIERGIDTIDEDFMKYSNSNCDDGKSHNERILESQFDILIINSKALRDSINKILNNINQVIGEIESP